MEITFARAVKVWWGFMWRTWFLMFPMFIIIFPVMYWVMPIPKPGEPPAAIPPQQMPGFFGKMFLIWILMAVGGVVVQALAMKWTLKTKWSDFSLRVVPANPETPPKFPLPDGPLR